MHKIKTSTQTSSARRNRINETIIRMRRSAFDRLLNISDDLVLNSVPSVAKHLESDQITIEISETIKRFKEQAIGPDGNHVNYAKLKHSDIYQHYRRHLTPQLRTINLDVLGDRKQATAFWINLYNALVIEGVIQTNISASVTEGFLGIMRFFYRTAYNIGGLRFSLMDIEHGILRANQGGIYLPGAHFSKDDPRFKYILPETDARLHFALNCASRSCPPISAYSAQYLDEQLDLATRNFLDQEVRLDAVKDRLYVTLLLKWYQADFGGKSYVYAFLSEYLPDDERRAWIRAQKQPGNLYYLPYNWSLNI